MGDDVADGAGRRPSIWPEPSQDRRRLGVPGTVVVAVVLSVSFWASLSTLPRDDRVDRVVLAAVATVVVAVLALRSVPLRWVVRGYALTGALLMARLGVAGGSVGLDAASTVLLWAATTAVALGLCPGRGAGRSIPDPLSALGARAAAAAVAAVMVAAGALLGGPAARSLFDAAPADGGPPDQLDRGPDNALSFTDSLDMTRRPRLTDRVVLAVRSDIVSFWRTATFDQWDGSMWTSSDRSFRRVLPDGRVRTTLDDVAARIGRPSTQEFRLEAGYASLLPVAPSATSVRGVDPIAQRSDGTLIAYEGTGSGASYRVTSRQVPVDATTLRSAGSTVPTQITERYGATPRTTARVRRLAREVTAGATNDYDRVRAIETWMGRNTRYSIDAPLAPVGVDVVDDFLFESQEGWCEQIASSLVVMLREVGVPARLATGFVPGEWDPVGGRFVVRERDAHAWAEVWFAGVGWVPFDPTADVPLAGESDASAQALPVGTGPVAFGLLAGALLAVLVGPALRRLRGRCRRMAERRRLRRLARSRWDVAAELRLDRLGRRLDQPRRAGETVAHHAGRLGDQLGDPRLARVGDVLDRARYGPSGPDADDRRLVDEALASAGERSP